MVPGSGWMSVKHGSTEYRINVPIVERIVHSMYINLYVNNNCGEQPIGEASVLVLYKVRMTSLDTDWAAARKYADSQTAEYMRDFVLSVQSNPVPWGPALSALMDISAQQREAFLAKMGAVQTKNMEALQTISKVNDAGMQALKGVQTGSAIALQVGATVLTGGSAALVLGMGATLKVATSYSETERISGAVVFDAATDAVWNVFKIGKEFKTAEEVAIVLVETSWQSGMELMQGKTGAEVITHAATKLAEPLMSKLTKIIPAKTLKGWAYPILKRCTDVLHPVIATGTVVAGLKSGVANKTLEKGGDLLREHIAEKLKEHHEPTGKGSMVKHSTITDKTVLYQAFFNVAKGQGKGW